MILSRLLVEETHAFPSSWSPFPGPPRDGRSFQVRAFAQGRLTRRGAGAALSPAIVAAWSNAESKPKKLFSKKVLSVERGWI